jgi:electron transfer flavoprotein beta subunit
MKVLVAVKRVVDANVRIRLNSQGNGVDTSGLKMAMNPFDEIAVEEALRLKEAGKASEVVVVSIGPAQAQETIRTALAMGADRGLLLETNERIEPLAVAQLLAEVVREEGAELVIVGKQAIDDDSNQTGQMLAALMDWPQATFASKLSLEGDTVTVAREVDTGLEYVTMTLPALVTTDLRLNTPRFASLPNIMKAKKKPLAVRAASELGIRLEPRLTVVATREPAARAPGRMVSSAAELVDLLRNEAKVI